MRRASLIEEATHQKKAQELSVGVSSSKTEVIDRSTTKGADTAVGTTEGVRTEGVGSEKLDLPAC